MSKTKEMLLDVQDLSVDFRIDRKTTLSAVRNVSFQVYKGETLGILGESGCGKSVTCMSILRLEPEKTTRYPSGRILFGEKDLLRMPVKELSRIRGGEIGMIFQEPMTAMNPLFTIGDQMMEVLRIHNPRMEKAEAYERCVETINQIKIPNPERIMSSYPFSLSGGMLQRIMIGMAMLNRPKLLICDEPTTALDVTIQAQILKLIRDLQKKYQLTTIYITHDLGVVANVADRIAVMYAGDIIEVAKCDELFYDPRHPYTWALLSSLPQLGVKGEDLYSIQGTPPSLHQEIHGDAFAPRNPYALNIDFIERPPFFEVTPTHKARTWLLDPRAPKVDPPHYIQKLAERRSRS